jgi:alkanesulfonate monooxygenase SsuD/methylene tetrahydromethanopterin reductase-like flavin-dependent oxidoreductase (luciferase family)
MFSPHHVREQIVPGLQVGLNKAGRNRSDIELLGQCFTVIEDDLQTAYRIGAGAMLFSIWASIYDDIFAAHGFAETVTQVRATQRTAERQRAIELIPHDMVDAFCAVGSIDRVRAKVREREGLLDTVILAVPATSTTREQQDHYRHKLLEAFAS